MPDSTPSWQRKAQEAYEATQAKIPLEWRINESLLAPAWVYKHDFEVTDDFNLDVRLVHRECGVLSQEELCIIDSDAVDIVDNIKTGQWSSVKVTTAFCKSAAIAQQLTRCCTELFFDRALARAQELDEYFQSTGQVIGCLHGLPISLKDQFELAGVRVTIGLSSMLDNIGKTDAAIVRALESQGAIIFVKSNVPQSLMSADSVNALWGRTQNPVDRSRTAGGSSGGEGALIKLRGSPLGIGSDIAGSIRIPSAMCGIYGLKPSSGRFPLIGATGCGAGAEFVPPVLGPMANSIADLELFCKGVIAAEPWRMDPSCLPLPWTPFRIERGQTLRIGVMLDNGLVRPQPPVARGVRDTAEKLRRAGHEVVEWNVSDLQVKAFMLAQAFFWMDGGATLRSFAKDEPILPIVDSGSSDTALQAPEIIGKYWDTVRLRAEYLERWMALGLDAVICPTASHTTSLHDEYNDVSNTVPWVLLDYSSTVLPVGSVTVRDVTDVPQSWADYKPRDVKPPGTPLNPRRYDSDNWADFNDEVKRRATVGLPLSIQVVTPPHQEERSLAIAALIESL